MSWRTARLEDVAQILGGGTPSRQEATYFGGGIAWATPTDVTALDGLYISATKESVTEAGLKSSSTKLMPPGAVLLTSRATIGYTAVATVPICTNQGFVNFVCGDALQPEFLAYWLRTQKDKMLQYAGGTTFKEIARGTLRKFEISFPPLAEQRRIVDLLSRAEGILRLRREAQAKTQAIIPALFLDMFGDPAMNPKGWPVHPLGDLLAESPTLGTMAKPSPTAARWLDLRVANIQDGQLTLRDKRWLDLEPNQIERFALRDGDLLLARAIGSLDHLGKAVIVHPTGPWTFDSHLMRIRVNRGMLLPEYLKSLLESKSGRTEFLKHTRHSAVQYNINGKEIRRLTIPVPPIDMQINFQERRRVVLGLAFQQVIALKKSQAIFEGLLDSTLN
jgi:type I restriction enzyme S subunit